MNIYKLMKAMLAVMDMVYCAVFIVVIISQLYESNFSNIPVKAFLPFCISLPILVLVQSFLVFYYRRLVINVGFDNENVIVNTYHKQFILPNKYFTEVYEDLGLKRTFIKYNDGKTKITFIFTMIKINPSKIYHLNISDMKKHMPYTKFR